MRVTERSLLATLFQQTIAVPSQLIADQTRDQIDGRHGLGLSLTKSRFQHSGDATQSQLS